MPALMELVVFTPFTSDSVVPVRAYKCSEGDKLHDKEGRMRAI